MNDRMSIGRVACRGDRAEHGGQAEAGPVAARTRQVLRQTSTAARPGDWGSSQAIGGRRLQLPRAFIACPDPCAVLEVSHLWILRRSILQLLVEASRSDHFLSICIDEMSVLPLQMACHRFNKPKFRCILLKVQMYKKFSVYVPAY
jgi:hypothetical protein